MKKTEETKTTPTGNPDNNETNQKQKKSGITAAQLDNITKNPVNKARPDAGDDLHSDGTWVDYGEKENP